MTRYTRRDAEAAFVRLSAACNRRIATSYDDKGAWTLDHNATYGGYVVSELLHGGGESRPLGDMRRNAREFCEAVRFAIEAIQVRENDETVADRCPMDGEPYDEDHELTDCGICERTLHRCQMPFDDKAGVFVCPDCVSGERA